jgi:hypothetical protein
MLLDHCYCGPGQQYCYKVRIANNVLACCNVGEGPSYVRDPEFPVSCNDPGFECGYAHDRQVLWCLNPTKGPYECTEYYFESCGGDDCIDDDHDTYPRQSPTCSREPFDCDDTNPAIHPNQIETNCTDPIAQVEDCDGLRNCADSDCYIGHESECEQACDYDDDGVWEDRPGCDGPDCDDTNPNMYGG